MHNDAPLPGFTPALKVIKADAKGRANIGTVVADAKGRVYGAAVDTYGRILLTPASKVGPDGLSSGSDAAQARRDRAVEHG